MDQDCVVFGCRNSSVIFQAKKNDCSFFNFPLNQPDLLAKWLKKLNLEKWSPGPENVICEEHFSLESFEIVDNKRMLKPGAIPSMTDDWRRIITNHDSFLNKFDESDVEDIDELSNDIRCRICANFLNASNAIDISSQDDNVMEKMMACIPILVKSEDSLPKHICRSCLTDLNISYRMLVRAIESEKLFNNLISKVPYKSTENDEEIIENTIKSEKAPPSDCVICSARFDSIDDLNDHFREKHVDEFDFIDANVIENPANQMECDNFDNENVVLTLVGEKDIENEDIKNGSIIELGFQDDTIEVEDEKDSEEITTLLIKTKWICDVCTMSFTSKDVLDFHKENFHKPEQLTFEECTKLEDESEDDPEQYFVCQFCMQVFCTVDELNEHLETHIGSLACDVCGCLCQDFEKLKKHRETHVKRTSKNNTCPICFTVFLSHTEMAQHSKDVHHIKETKDDAAPQKWICKYCGKEIGTKLSLSIHERIHTGVRPYVCECCGRSFKSKANLIQHQPVHTGVKRYKCSVCDKAFARKAFVTTHMRVHTGERPFRCEICGNRYTQIGDMRRHKKKHSIEETTSLGTFGKPIAVPSLPTRTIQEQQDHLVHDNVTDFRRILVELQQ